MSQKEVTIVGRNNTKVEVTGQKELLVRIGSMAALGMATEATLQLVLSAIQNGSEFEAKLVVDAADVTWLEVRTWNTSSGTWNTPQYYLPGSNTAGVPTGAINYINPSSYLATIASNTTGINLETTQQSVLTELQTANTNLATLATETTLSTLSTWITTSAATETTLNALLTAFNAEDFATETTLAALSIWLQANAATETTLQSVLTELQGINLDTNGLSQETTQLLVLTAINSVVTNTTGLATEVTLNALLTAFNAEDFATETTLALLNSNTVLGNLTLNNLLTAFNAEDFATETTLALIQAVTAQITFTGGDLNVSANMQVGGTDVSAANPVPVVLPIGTETPYYEEYIGPVVTQGTPLGVKSVSLFNEGPSRWQISMDTLVWFNFNEGQIVEWAASEGKTLNQIYFRKLSAGGRLIMSYTI